MKMRTDEAERGAYIPILSIHRLEHRDREAFAIAGRNRALFMAEDRPTHIFGATGSTQAILRAVAQRMDYLRRITDPHSRKNRLRCFEAMSRGPQGRAQTAAR